MKKQMRGLRLKRVVLEYAALSESDVKSYREFEVPRSTFYRWKKAYAREGEVGLIRKKPIAKSHPRQIPAEVVEKIVHLPRVYDFGPNASPGTWSGTTGSRRPVPESIAPSCARG